MYGVIVSILTMFKRLYLENYLAWNNNFRLWNLQNLWDEGWKLNRNNYYQEGWLATGNVRGIVGVTFTTSHCKKTVDFPLRTNYNLRGHRSELAHDPERIAPLKELELVCLKVTLVKWNEPYQKLASCDASGIIFVWIKYEGRWSIELINDRNTPVTHFSWSHDGRMALICYQDGFVLVGSVAGQRYWSSMLNLDATITCGIWTPDDQQVYFGTTAGEIIVMDVHGAMVSHVHLSADVGITSMAWSCEKFKMEEGDDSADMMGAHNAATAGKNEIAGTNGTATAANATAQGEKKFVLAVSFQNGQIYLLSTFDDLAPVQINTELQGPLCMEWSNSREILAVSGITLKSPTLGPQMEYTNMLQFYTEKGILLYKTQIPDTQARVSTLTWGHNDKRLFLATGNQIHIAWVAKRIASLQLLCRLRIYNLLPTESLLVNLPLPLRLRNIIGNLFAQTIRCCVPEPSAVREFVSRPPVGSVRLHCTMIRHDEESNLSSGTCYTLYLEYLGGLVPLLKGKRTSKIRPEFVIFDPQGEELHIHHQNHQQSHADGKSSSSSSTTNASSGFTESSESEREDGCTASPRMPRKRKKKKRSATHKQEQDFLLDQEDLSYVDTLSEQIRLVEVTSNIWGTKFKIHGLANVVPANLGQVTYKTSLLHLQPRQMTLVITELRDDFPLGPDPTFNPNLFSEDEEEPISCSGDKFKPGPMINMDKCPPIAPMSPRTSALNRQRSQNSALEISSSSCSNNNSRDEKSSFLDAQDRIDHIRPQNLLRPTTSQNSTSFIGQYGGKSSSQSQKHAISPICCEVSVPALQSPKNAVAPSDIIFDRPSAPTIISYTTNSSLQVKSTNFDYSKMDSPLKSDISVSFNINNNNDGHKPIVIRKNEAKSQLLAMIHHNEMCQPTTSKDIRSNSHAVSNKENLINNNNNINKSKETKTNANKELSKKESILKTLENHSKEPKQNSNCKPLSEEQPTSSSLFMEPMIRSCSVGYLDMVDVQLVPSDVRISMLNKDVPKRLILVNSDKNGSKRRQSRLRHKPNTTKTDSRLNNFGKSKSLDSSDIFPNSDLTYVIKEEKIPEQIETVHDKEIIQAKVIETTPIRKSYAREFFSSPLMRRRNKDKNSKHKRDKSIDIDKDITEKSTVPIHTQALANLERLITRLREDDGRRSTPPSSPRLPRSQPASPVPTKKGSRPQSASPIRRRILNSPLLNRKNKKNKNQESSDDEVNASGDEVFNGANYRDLETFQKSQLRQKLKRGKIEPNGPSLCNIQNNTPQRREFVMHNKAPMWNENSQVYQLDFGGRVTQESAKNFQIEFRGKQVMQFGRIDGNAYTLDFQYPFSALQAFAVALANVTQRLK